MGRNLRHLMLGSSALVGLAVATPAAAQMVGSDQRFEVLNGETVGPVNAGDRSEIIVRSGGTINGQGNNGLTLSNNGILLNEGTVTGTGGVYAFGPTTIVNAGTITGTNGAGVRFLNGGTITNTGAISSNSFGILNQGSALTLTNYGSITATSNNAPIYNQFAGMTLNLLAGSTVTNTTAFASAIESQGVGNSTITLSTGVGSTDPGVSVNGTQYIAPGARNAASVVGFIRLAGGGNTINLVGNGTGANDTGQAGTLSLSQLENVNTINKTDSGTWTLTGLPSFSGGLVYNVGTSSANGGRLTFGGGGLSGPINVINGTIRASSNGVFGTSTIYATRGTLELTGFNSAHSNAIILTADTSEAFNLQIEGGNTTTLSGAITSAGGATRGVNFLGAGTIALTGANSWAGVTTINSGTTLNGSTSSIGGSSITVGANGNLAYNQATAATTQAINGAGNLSKTGAGVLTVGNASTYTGRTTVAGGQLTVRDDIISRSSGVDLSGNSAILSLTTTGPDAPGAVLNNLSGVAGSKLWIGTKGVQLANSTNTIFAGTISGANDMPSSGSISTKTGSGKLTLTGDSTNLSSIIVNAGTLALGNGGTTGSIGGSISVGANGVLEINRSNAVTLDGVSGAGTINKIGTNVLTLTRQPIGNSFTGTLNVQNGSVAIGTANMLSLATVDLTSSASRLTNESGAIAGIGGLRGVVGSVVDVGAGITIGGPGNASYDGTFAPTIAGSIRKVGAGTQTFTRNLGGFGGALNVDAGTLAFANRGSAAFSNLTIANGATFSIAGVTVWSASIASLTGAGGSAIRLGDNQLIIEGGTNTFGGSITGGDSGSVLLNSGTLTLTSVSNFGGGLNIVDGATVELAAGSGVQSDVYVGGTLLAPIGGTAYINSLGGGGSIVLRGDSLGGVDSELDINDGGYFFGTIGIADGYDTGTLRLTGNTLFLDGNTSVSNIFLAGGNLNILGSVTGAIDVGEESALSFDRTVDSSYADVISGIGTIAKREDSTLTLDGVNTFSGTLTVEAGTLAIGADGSLAATQLVLQGGDLDVSAGTHIAQIGTLNGGEATQVLLGSNTLQINNGGTFDGQITGSGTLAQTGGVLTLSGVNSHNATTVSSDTTLALTGAGTLGAGRVTNNGFLDLALATSPVLGSLAGSGAVLLGTNTLSVGIDGSDSTFGGVISGMGGLTKDGTGVFTLSGVNTYTGLTDVLAGTLRLGASGVLADASTLLVRNGATLDLNGFDEMVRRFEIQGNLIGIGSLSADEVVIGGGTIDRDIEAGTVTVTEGTTVLNGQVGGSPITIEGGILRIGASERLDDDATLVVDSGGTFDLGSFNETLGTAAIAGTLDGTGTLTAATYTLNGATVNGNLGTGALTQEAGTSTLAGTSAASTVAITGGTLELGGADRLSDTAALSIASAGTLDLGAFSDTVGTAAIGGTLNGTGTLTAGSYTLNGAAVNANLGTGTLTQTAGTSTLAGTSAADTVALTGGALALGASDRLSDTAALTIGTGSTLGLGAFNDTVGSAAIGGTLNGTGTLTAGSYTLNGASVNANLGTGTLTQAAGTSTLSGTSAAGTVAITGGALTLGASDRLSDTAALSIGTGSTLGLGAFTDTVGSAAIGGTLNGTGTLTAGNYLLNGAAVNANLGAGTLTQAGGTSTLSGTSAAGTVALTGGALTLGASDRLSDTAALSIGTGSTLGLGAFSDTVGSAAIDGTLNGTGTLTAGSYTLNGAAVNANLGAGTLTQAAGTSTLTGTSGATSVDVTGGELTLGASDRLSDTAALSIGTGSTLGLGAFNDTVGSAAIGGTLNGTGTLTAGSYTLNGAIVNANLGAGALTQASGSSALNGASGAATIAVTGGTLALGSNGSVANGAAVTMTAGTLDLSAGTGTVALATLNGTSGTVAAGSRQLTVATGGSFGGTITGTSGLTIASGAEVLTGNNSYSGATVLTGATSLTLGNGGTTGSVAGAIETGTGSVTVNRSNAVTLAGPISGGGSFVQSGAGTTTLTGANSYTGGTTVTAGTLIGSATSIRGDVQNAGQVEFAQAGNASFAGATRGAGTFAKSGAGNLTLTGTSASNWSVTGGTLTSASGRFTGNAAIANGATLAFEQSGAGTYAGALSGAGTFTVGGGTQLILTGNSSGFTGTTTVGNAGGANMLSVNGTLGGTLNVLTGGRLQGSGTIGNTSVAGTVAPGNSIGTLNVAGNFAFASGSVYEVEANAAGASDRIIATGAATIGSNVAVNVIAENGNYGINTNYTILTAAGGVTGTFSGATTNLAFLTPTLTYGATSVTLSLRRNTIEFGTVGQTSNQRAIAPAVEQLGLGNPVYNAVVALTAAEARGAFDQLAGSEYASVRGSMLEDSRFVRDAVLARGETAGTTGVAMWGRALGSWGHMDGNAEAQRYDRDVKGILTGFDGSLNEHLRIGAAVGYGSTKLMTGRGQQDLDSYHAGGYVLGNYGVFSVQLGGAYAWNDAKATRRVSFGTISQSLAADYSTRTFQVFGEVAAKANLGGIMLQPFAGVAHVTLFDGQLVERGGSAALRGGNTNERVTFGTLGLRTKVDLGAGDLGLRFTGSAAVRHAFGDRVPTIDLAFATGPAFTAIGRAIEKNSIAADAGLQADLSETVTVGISYTGNYGKRSTDHGGRASLSFRF